MKVIQNKFFRIALICTLIFIFVFSFFFDIALSNFDIPVLTTICFFIFIIYRFIKPQLR
ncbi:MAG: hypothetical protein QG630_462 [Patescibacteria group bacterium]|nr:hypothetical protein [Patescibacteria group bacterium]